MLKATILRMVFRGESFIESKEFETYFYSTKEAVDKIIYWNGQSTMLPAQKEAGIKYLYALLKLENTI